MARRNPMTRRSPWSNKPSINLEDYVATNAPKHGLSAELPFTKHIKSSMFPDVEQFLRIEEATEELKKKTEDKNNAYQAYNQKFSAGADHIDFLRMDEEPENAEPSMEELWGIYKQAEQAERDAQKNLWSVKYDTMTNAELQAELVNIKDKDEKSYIITLQENRVKDKRKKELDAMSAVGDPESPSYDPAFLEKGTYRSTAVTDGSLGESDTGYADIDYEFINGNPDISELIVGMDRNYYQITDEERSVYNYWYAYDRKNGTSKADTYLNLLQESLNDRDSDLDYAKIKGKTLQELGYAFKSGWSSYGNNVNDGYLQEDGYIPRTSTEMTAEKAREGLGDVWDFVKINGSSLGQLAFDGIQNLSYNMPAKIIDFITVPYAGWVGKSVGNLFSGLEVSGKEYKNLIRRGYTPQQAKDYGNLMGIGNGVLSTTSDLALGQMNKLWENAFSDQDILALGKILTKEDWLGVTDALQSTMEDYFFKGITSKKTADVQAARSEVKQVITDKALDKLFNQMKATPEELSADLRQSLLRSLKDPKTQGTKQKTGMFTPAQREEIMARLEEAGDADEGVGTYVGDVLFGPGGFTISRQYLQDLAEQAYANRDLFPYDPSAQWLYERYKNSRP